MEQRTPCVLGMGHLFVLTMAVYGANRDLMRARIPISILRTRTMISGGTSSYTAVVMALAGTGGLLKDGIDWSETVRIWMQFLDEHKNRGGRVCQAAILGSCSGCTAPDLFGNLDRRKRPLSDILTSGFSA